MNLPPPARIAERHSDITAICPDCQDAVTATPIEERGTGYEAQINGLKCDRCGYFIELPVAWVARWLYVAEK